MPTFTGRAAVADVLAQPEARRVLDGLVPEFVTSPTARNLSQFPIEGALRVVYGVNDPRVTSVLEHLGQLENTTPRAAEAEAIEPRLDYEAEDVPRGSARLRTPASASVNRLAEIVLDGPSHGNPFVDVEISAWFRLGDREIVVGGVYDGDGHYLLRFLPPEVGGWSFETCSTAASLDKVHGHLDVAESDAPGVVGVTDTYHFAHADGTAYFPLGTTAYAWTHQGDALQEATLRSLAGAPFTKIRMCLFPKDFIYSRNEPEWFVFPRKDDGWDTERFDLNYFRRLERRIRQLDEIGVQADLILFHPYDRWGFSRLGRAADDRYVTYVVRRLAAFPNVWWSLANEYDLLLDKGHDDWHRLGKLVTTNDHAGHLLSIHNWLDVWDYQSDWATHCSVQAGHDLGPKVRQWRDRWAKPVLIDECGYEGDLDQGWGSLLAEEEVHRFWQIALSGGYATHGETYYSDDEVIFWAKGGELRGDSPDRLRFLRRIVEESPTGRLEPMQSNFDDAIAGIVGRYVLMYFGANRPRFRHVAIPEGMRARVDVIDIWNMTIDEISGTHEGDITVPLPARPYIAIRLRAME